MLKRSILFAAAAVLALSACATVTTSTPSQVTTLTEAEQATTLVAGAADTYVKTGHPTQAQLQQMLALSNAVSTALSALETAQANNQSLVFDSFNAALSAFQSYQATLTAPAAS